MAKPGAQLLEKTAAADDVMNTVSIVDIGKLATQRLNRATGGTVIAVHRRSAYIELDCPEPLPAFARIVCLVAEELGYGPLHLMMADHDRLCFQSLAAGMNVLPANSDGWFVGKFFLRTAGALCPSAAIHSLSPTGWTSRLDHVQAHIDALTETAHAPIDSLSAKDNSVKSLCREPVLAACQVVSEWLSHDVFAGECSGDAPSDVQAMSTEQALVDALPLLMGAGIGLTPSGDDLLAGVLLALHRLDQTQAAEKLWSLIQPLLSTHTHAISAALLAVAATEGRGSDTVEYLLNDLALTPASAPPDVTHLVRRLNSIGATSGWDMLAGIQLVSTAVFHPHLTE